MGRSLCRVLQVEHVPHDALALVLAPEGDFNAQAALPELLQLAAFAGSERMTSGFWNAEGR